MRLHGSWIRILLLTLALFLGAASSAHATNCSDPPYFGVIDGNFFPPPSQIQIDENCTFRNYPASNPLTTNISFLTQPGQTQQRWLVIFDNVVHTGQMACNSVAGHKIWFVNGSSSTIQTNCQNLLIPVEKIDKQNPAGQTTATIGVPFTYSLIIPVLYDPATGNVIDSSGSPNELHSVTVTDDLNATGVDLTYLSHVAYWKSSGAPVPHTFSNVGGVLTFDNFPIIPIGEQIVIEITVVLDDTPTNALGTQFVNTAKWEFGRLIDGVFYQPLPGEWGVSPPLTIAAPQIVVTKTGPATLGLTLNLGQWGVFTIDAQNTGLTDAWNVTLLDRLPDGSTGGMCDLTPQILSAQVFEADGVTPVPGKGPLTPGTDFSVSYSSAPTCELTLKMLTAKATIGPNEHLIVTYRTQLDADSQDGVMLTNVAGATQWFNGDSSNPDRQVYTGPLTDGTVGVADNQDAHTVTVALYGYFFEKTVTDASNPTSPAGTAAPGDTVRYTLRLQATDVPLDDVTFRDDMGALNSTAVFVPGSLRLVPSTIPLGADVTNTDPNGGTNGAGMLDIRHLSVPVASEIAIQFEITLKPTLTDGTIVLNQSELLSGVSGAKLAVSDDPTINGQADPNVAGDEDPTQLLVQLPPPPALSKATTQATASIGQTFTYQITVPSTPHTAPLYDVRILDDLSASAANLEFVSVTKVSTSGSWTPTNTGTATNLVIEDPVSGIDIPAGDQAVVEITVRLLDTSTNVAGLSFTNTAAYTYDLIDNDDTSQRQGPPGTSGPMTVVEPELTLEKSGPASMTIGPPGTFTLDVHDTGGGSAYDLTITDRLPNGSTGGTCDTAPTSVTARLFQSDGVTPVSAALVQGTDFSVAFNGAPACQLTLTILTDAGAIGPDQRLIVTYQTQLDAGTQDGVPLTNVAGATQWFSAGDSDPDTVANRRTYTRTLTDGTVGVLDHQDAHTVIVALQPYLFEKTVADVTSNANPATVATPGDRLHYTLRIENAGTTPLSGLSIRDELDRLNNPPAFAPNTLQIVSAPVGADTSNTSSTGGAAGTGVVDVRNLDVPASSSISIEFEVTLAPVIVNGTYVANQSQLLIDGVPFAQSDDPNVNGPADPFVVGDEDPTRVLIQSAPAFRVEKVSTDLTGDPAVLLAGDTLRYTITVENVGTEDAVGVVLRDQIPTNTQYVVGSTTLNGTSVPDSSGGSPLSVGIPINTPGDPPGAVHADASTPTTDVATIVFDVIVDAGVADGTVISNQAFVDTPGTQEQPSDDPRTPIPDDPTRDVVGNSPLLFATKSVAILQDGGTAGVVDPGDVLHYTITIYNTGNAAATGVLVIDGVPANTTYVADSTTLNQLAWGRPDGGSSPLAAGIPASSGDLPPPSPGSSGGTITAGQSAVIEYNLRVNANVAPGTPISNQAVVHSDQLPNLLTDGDGDPTTGPEPTVVVVGGGQQLSITKQVAVVGGGAALPGSQLEYVVRVTNVGTVPATDVVITDDLDASQLTYVVGSASLNGSPTGVSVAGSLITADYSTPYGPLQSGDSIVLLFRAVIGSGLPTGTTVTNTGVVTWNAQQQTANASVSIDVGGMPGVGVLNGTVWHDANFDNVLGAGDDPLQGWTVALYRNGQSVQSVLTDASGSYRFAGVAPNDTNGDQYEIRFTAPGAGTNTAALGLADSAFTNNLQRISKIVVPSGANLQNLNLPIDPDGVVYDALLRTPIAGATLTMLNASGGVLLPSGCFDDPNQQGQVTRSDGYYKFDINFSDSLACPSGGDYLIAVAPPGSGFTTSYSQIIPPSSDSTTPPFSVPTCPGDAVPATTECEAQPQDSAPPPSTPPGSQGTRYYVHLTLNKTGIPGTSQIFNNHIPLDPVLNSAVSISKTTPLVNVSRGQLVPYTITVNSQLDLTLLGLNVVDTFPAGFHYVKGSARVDGAAKEPTVAGRTLVWTDLGTTSTTHHTIKLLLAVGAGVGEGEYVNHARAVSGVTGNPLTGDARATVRVVPDPTFSCTDVLGKVFDDVNRNGVQDAGEHGLAGVRLVTARGLAATTDQFGRYHITCALTPRDGRGSNFILKLDDRTLPTGYRMSNRQVQVQRATAGKALRFDFAASTYRVVSLDMADGVFEPGSTRMRAQWKPRVDLLLGELKKSPAILRLSYIADVEDSKLVKARLAAVKKQITEAWEKLDCCYALTIETEVFWHRGGPPNRHTPLTADRR